MNPKIICRRVRYCFDYEVQYILNNDIELKAGSSLMEIYPESEPAYERKLSNEPAGNVVKETLTVEFRNETASELTWMPYMPVILLLDTDSGTIVMGSKIFPCSVEVSQTGKSTQLIFSAENPLR